MRAHSLPYFLLAAVLLLAPGCGHTQKQLKVVSDDTSRCRIPDNPGRTPVVTVPDSGALQRMSKPPVGKLYHGVFPGGPGWTEDDFRPDTLGSYERTVEQPTAWVYTSHNWYRGLRFPRHTAELIRRGGAVPYIRLMPRSCLEHNDDFANSPFYPLTKIGGGVYDPKLKAWMRAARAFASPLIVEFGTEVNGKWFPWNAAYNGNGERGAASFRRAFAHLVWLARGEGAHNITWVFHVAQSDYPGFESNTLEAYYPGDKWVDWVAISIYGAQLDGQSWIEVPDVATATRRLRRCAPTKPLVIAELGTTRNADTIRQARWAGTALRAILNAPDSLNIIGFSWWNSTVNSLRMRVQDNRALADTFRTHLKHPTVVNRPNSEPAPYRNAGRDPRLVPQTCHRQRP